MGVVALVVALGGVAYASIPGPDGNTKGCYALTGGLALGIPYSKGDVRVVDSAEACRSYEKAISFGGGDITSVTAGTGLAGGGTNGAVDLSVSPSYRLPQGCGVFAAPEWDPGLSSWKCGLGAPVAGTGLNLLFPAGQRPNYSLEPSYQLPQGCNDGDLARHATVGGLGVWKCVAPPPPPPPPTTTAAYTAGGGRSNSSASVSVPAGKYTVVGQANVANSDGDDQDAVCSLQGAVVFSTTLLGKAVGGALEGFDTVPITGTATLASPGNITVACGGFAISTTYARVTATKVDSIN